MKVNKIFVFIPLAIIIVSSGIFLFMNKDDSTVAARKNNKPRIVLIAHLYDNPYWQIVKQGAEEAAKKRGCVLEYNGPQAASVKESLKLIDTAIAAKVDGIITYVQEENEYIPLINKAVERGIPVITIDTDAESSKRAAYVGTDNDSAGTMAAKEMINIIGINGSIGVIMGGATTTNQIERVSGFQHFIDANSKLKIVSIQSSDSYVLEAELAARRILLQNKEINGLFCASALDGIGAAKAITELNLQGKVTIVSFDDLPDTLDNIKKGVIQATIVQKPYQMGYNSVELMMNKLKGETVEGKFITGTMVIKKDNVNNYESKRGKLD